MKAFDIRTFQAEPGITLIEASAGTGKTFSITAIVTELIASGQCKIDEVLVLTFTNAATAELKERIRKELQKASVDAESAGDAVRCRNLANAVDAFDNAAIQTIHGFCQRTLHEFSLENGLSAEFEVLKDTQEFDLRVKTTIIRRIQQESVSRPELIPFCSLIGFEEDFIGTILRSRQARGGILGLSSHTDEQSELEHFSNALQALRRAWLDEREAIKASLLHPKDYPLKRDKYKAKDIDRTFSLFDRWVDENKMGSDLFRDFERYQFSKLSGELKQKKTLPSFRFFELCDSFGSSMDPLLFYVLRIINEEMTRELEELNERQQRLRYDDLLDRLCETLRRNASLAIRLREQFRFGLIDEFQDTDPVQFEILEHIFARPMELPEEEAVPTRPLILIGDPKQAIYGFRGGDIFTYLKAKQLSAEQYYLTTNWRSAPEINEGMNTLLSGTGEAPFAFSWLGYEPVQTAPKNQQKAIIHRRESSGESVNLSGIHFRELPSEGFSNQYLIYRQLVRDVQGLLNGDSLLLPGGDQPERPVQQSDIAILVPYNTTGAIIRRELGRVGIQATQSGGSSVMETDEAKDWYRILLALLSPRRSQSLRSALSTTPFAFTSSDIRSLESDYERWSDILSAFGRAHESWMHGRFAQAIGFLKNHFGWIANLGRSADPLRVLTDHHHILELLLTALEEQSLQPGELVNWLKQKIQSPDTSNEMEVLRLERDAQSVSILTMHKAKGLQFPIVFLPFPPKAEESKDLDLPFVYHEPDGDAVSVYAESQVTGNIREARQQEALSEKLRLSYVAITRAEYQCVIYLSEKNSGLALTQWNIRKTESAATSPKLSRDGAFLWSRLDMEESEEPFDSPIYPEEPERILPADPPDCPPSIVQWSFTGMIQNHSDYIEPGTDEISIFSTNPEVKSTSPNTADISGFEKGTHAGLFFHALLQYVDFSRPDTWIALTEETLTRHGYNTEEWTAPVVKMLEDLVSTAFQSPDSGVFIDSVDNKKLFRETEFTFPLRFNPAAHQELRHTVESWQQQGSNAYTLPGVDAIERVLEGYMKGVIDAWFEMDGRIYLLDWKSNWLGSEAHAYADTVLTTAMNDHHYHLQYLLYTCALLKYLNLIRPGFDYDRDFAGAYYVFLRGLTPGTQSDGIYYAKPPLAVVDAMNRCFQS